MALPTNRIKKIKTPDDNTYDIVPEMLGKDGYSAELPATLTANSTIALTSDIPTTYLKSAGVSGTFNNTLTISKQDDTLVTFCNYFHSPTYSTGLSIASGRGVNDLYVPEASTTSSGVMSTSAQTFAGLKTFKSTFASSYGAVMPDTSSYVANRTIATTDDIPTNIQNGSTAGSLQQVFDGSTFNFVNPNSPLNGTTINIGIATGTYATMLGGKGRVEGKRSFVNGTQVIATGNYAHAEGNNTQAAGVNSHAEGIQTYASGSAAHAEGSSTAATETGAHSEGYGTHADGVYTHSEGSTNFVLGDNAHAEGGSNIVGVYSGPSPEPGPAPEPGTAVHAEGMGSHAEGNNNTITGAYSHAEGQGNTISSNRAHAEGNGNTVSGLYAHAEGNGGAATGEGAHSEGLYSHAVGNYSHAEGAATYANGMYSHTAGQDSAANGTASFASGYHLAANRDYQTVLGKYNLGQADTLLEVGKGTAENARSNAFEVYADGHATVGLMGSTNLSVATKQYVDSNDTKNTAGSTNNTSKLFLIGATSQATNPQTYSRNNTYINANGVLVNTTGFSSYSYATSSGSGLLNIGTNAVNYYSGSGPASFKATSSTHGSWQINDNNTNIYIQKTGGSASSGNAYLLFPNVGTSSAPKTIATTDDAAKVVSAEFVEEVSNITFTVANVGYGPTTVNLTFEVPGNLTWEDLANNNVQDSTNTYTISIYNGNVTLNSNVQYIISTASNRNNPVSTTSIPTDGATYYYVNPAALN